MIPPASALRLVGTHNFRSLRGIYSTDGRRIAGDIVLRSDRLNSLTPEDWAALRALGLKTICDLRGLEERTHAPTPLIAEFRPNIVQFDIRNDVRSDPELAGLLINNPTAKGAERLMHEIYRRFPDAFAGRLAEWFTLLGDGTPMLVHCTAGKDRTGFLIALLLYALGVPREQIEYDYMLSASGLGVHDPRIPGLQALYHQLGCPGVSAEALIPVLAVQTSYLAAAFDSIDNRYGSIDAYLQRHAGLDATGLQRLRDRCLEPAGTPS